MPVTAAIITNEPSVSRELAYAYHQMGVHPICGLENLFSACPTSITHLHWPEETSDWGLPKSVEQSDFVLSAIKMRKSFGKVISEVHNFTPHRVLTDDIGRKFLIDYYSLADVIGHCSKFSYLRFVELYPELAPLNHIVHPPFSYQRHTGYEPSAQRIASTTEQPYFLYAGATRTYKEIHTAIRAFQRSKVAKFQLIAATRLQLDGRLSRKIVAHSMRCLPQVNHVSEFIPLERLSTMFQTAQAVIITRAPTNNNSGIFFQAIENGAPIIAPDTGAFKEILRGTSNFLYESGSVKSCANAIKAAASADVVAIRRENLSKAVTWGWPKIVEVYLDWLNVKNTCD